MKKALLVILSTILCLSLLCGCTDNAPDKDEGAQATNDSTDSTDTGALIPKHENDCDNIDQRLASEIKTAYCRYTNDINYNGEQKFQPEDIYISRYDGEVGGCHFAMLGGDDIDYTTALREVDVAGYIIIFGSGQPMYAYTDGDLYTLKQAYDNGLLTDSDIYEIGTRIDPSFSERYASSETDTAPTPPAMVIEDGYSVVVSETLSIPVTENKSRTAHTARIAALKNGNGDNALYLDVLSDDNKILSSITWKGYYQLFITSEGTLILMRLSVSPITQHGTALYQFFEVSDSKVSGYDVIQLDSPQINAVAGEGESLSFAIGSPAATAMYEHLFDNFKYGFQYTLEGEVKAGREVYMLAECYLEPSSPTVYSNTQKVSPPNFEEKVIADKYTWDYAAGLFE